MESQEILKIMQANSGAIYQAKHHSTILCLSDHPVLLEAVLDLEFKPRQKLVSIRDAINTLLW